jgi:sarcosine oxidase
VITDKSADVIVVGLGAMGSAAAQHMAERGCRVHGFDLFTPPHVHGSSHGLSRIFRQAYFEDVRYVPLLLRSAELWERLEQQSGQQLLHRVGAMVIGPQDGQLVSRSEQSARDFHLPHQLLRSAEIKARYPVVFVEPDTVALLEQNAGYLVPEACVEQQLRQAYRAGAQMHYDEAVMDWAAAPGGGVTVRTTRATYSAERLVVTAGPWAPRLLSELGLPLRVTRQVLCWFEPKRDIADFGADRLPVYLFEPEAGTPMLYGFPLIGAAAEGVKVALDGSDELCTPETVVREIRPADEEAVRKRLAVTLPSLAGRMIRAETCLYTMTPDEHFVIGAHPHSPAVLLALGFSGHGFKFAPAIGEVLADLVIEACPRYDLGLFAPDRYPHRQRGGV